jgi:hypothetical protein
MTRSLLILSLIAGASAFNSAPMAPASRHSSSASCSATRPGLPRRALLASAFFTAAAGLAGDASAKEDEAADEPKVDCIPACNKECTTLAPKSADVCATMCTHPLSFDACRCLRLRLAMRAWQPERCRRRGRRGLLCGQGPMTTSAGVPAGPAAGVSVAPLLTRACCLHVNFQLTAPPPLTPAPLHLAAPPPLYAEAASVGAAPSPASSPAGASSLSRSLSSDRSWPRPGTPTGQSARRAPIPPAPRSLRRISPRSLATRPAGTRAPSRRPGSGGEAERRKGG